MNPLDLNVPAQLSLALGPEIVLVVGAMVMLLWAAWRRETPSHQRAVGIGSIVVAVLSLATVIMYLGRFYSTTPGPLVVDNFRLMADVVILLGAICTIALAIDENPRVGVTAPEAHALVLLSASGMMLLAGAGDLMTVFLGIELMSIAVYALTGINRRSILSAEGALKYFLLGAFSTGFLLYGIALVYGATGTTNLALIGNRIVSLDLATSPLLLAGMGLLLIGFGFKVAAVPFHMWAPDAYDGAPAAITAFMAATVKAAAFVAFIRVWLLAFPSVFDAWHPALAGLAIATMLIGNAIGLIQRNLKRMLAYSSIGHAGYLMVAIAAGTGQGASAMLFYLLIYTLATYGAFAVITIMLRDGETTVTMDEFAGLWTVRPWLAAGMAVMMLSLLGFPIFGGAGFFAKWYVLQAALQAPVQQTTLAVVLVLASVVSTGYYMHVVMVMFMRPRVEGIPAPRPSGALPRVVLVSTVVLVLVLGVVPDLVVRLTWAGRPAVAAPAAVARGTAARGMPTAYSPTAVPIR